MGKFLAKYVVKSICESPDMLLTIAMISITVITPAHTTTTLIILFIAVSSTIQIGIPASPVTWTNAQP